MKVPMHPSGLTMDRWEHPFKTAQERQLVINHFEKMRRKSLKVNEQEIKDRVQHLEDAPW